MNDKFNVCELMRSKDMREYYRNIELDKEQKMYIIKSCYNPLSKQFEYMKQLDYQNDNLIKNMIELYEIMITLFYNPEKLYPNSRFLYIVNEEYFIGNTIDNLSISHKLDTNGFYDTYENISEIIEFYKDDDNIDIDLFVIPNNGKIFNPITFKCANIDSTFEPFRCLIPDDSPIYTDIANIYNSNIYRFESPFKNKDILKIKLPGMEKPIYGKLYKDIDQQGTVYEFLDSINPYDRSALDLSYIDINISVDYCKFDWLEKCNDNINK